MIPLQNPFVFAAFIVVPLIAYWISVEVRIRWYTRKIQKGIR